MNCDAPVWGVWSLLLLQESQKWCKGVDFHAFSGDYMPKEVELGLEKMALLSIEG